MTANYAKHLSTTETPQSEPIPGEKQVKNSAGGFVYQVDKWTMLDRFLILGAEGNTYYSTERKMTQDNAKNVGACITEDGPRTVDRIVEVSVAGRAPKNDPAIFALALACTYGNSITKEMAYRSVLKVCRTGTYLFQFVDAVTQMRGWSRGLRSAVGDWYRLRPAKDLAFQAVKYQQRGGWSHRDLLRLSHPNANDADQPTATNDVFHWIVKGWDSTKPDAPDAPGLEHLRLIWAFEKAKLSTSAKNVVRLIVDYDLPREDIPTQYLTEPEVWEALLVKMPIEAMTRNLANMTRCGLLKPLSTAAKTVSERLGDAERIRKSRLHPIKVLAALMTYGQGHGERSSRGGEVKTWMPVPQVVEALDKAFYLAFDNVEPTGKRYVLALDVSGSMGDGVISGVPGLTPRVGSAAMAMVTARTENQYVVLGFTSSRGGGDGISVLPITGIQTLGVVVKTISDLPFGGTDCALPMLWAEKNKVEADVFSIYTDSETYAGHIHPIQALRSYRESSGLPAKLVICGMIATEFSLADPNDAGSMDCVGFDVATPQLISEFIRGF